MSAGSGWSCDVTVERELAMESASLHAVAREVAKLIGRGDTVDGLLTAREVAARFNVDRGWVYAHAEELGVIRLGDGPRPRLRFDPAVVAQRVLMRPAPAAVPQHPNHPRARAPLLPIKPSRERRTLDPQREATNATESDRRGHRA
jgi:hypothetical protein